MLDEDPFSAFPFIDGCFMGTAALWSLATPLSAIVAHLESLLSPFTNAMLNSVLFLLEKWDLCKWKQIYKT